MYSWRAIRIICLLLLLIPVAHLVVLVARDVAASLDPSPDAWQEEVDAIRRQDLAGKLPADPIVVLGGKRVKLWQGLEDMLAPRPVLMRGVGDAIIDDIIYYHQELIAYYRPSAVILLPGNSEFHIRDGKSADELLAGIRRLIELDESAGINHHLYVITPIKTPLYPGDSGTIEEFTEKLTQLAASSRRITALDANRLLRGPGGRPDAAYFRADGVNLNEHGYLRLTTLVQDRVD